MGYIIIAKKGRKSKFIPVGKTKSPWAVGTKVEARAGINSIKKANKGSVKLKGIKFVIKKV